MQALTRARTSYQFVQTEHWQALAFQFIHQGVTYQFSLTQTSVTITADKDTQLLVQGALIPLTAERPKEVHYQ